MSTNLSPQQVVKALEVLTNDETTELVFRLGVSLHVLNDIEKGRIYKIRAIQAWLDKDTGASWEKIISGLREIKKDVLAKEVAKQHCPQSPYVATPSSDPSQPASVLTTQPVTTPAPVTPAIPSSVATTSADDSEQSPNTATSDCTQSLAVDMRNVANVKATIRHLEKTFLNLISRTRSALCRKESQDREFLENFRDYLLILPVAQKAAHVKFFRESEDDILRARDIRKLFAILSRYWSYRNYEILRNIIYFFCENLQEGMQDYCRILEEFEKATTIDIYLTAISASQELSVAFIKMAVKINKPASLCTLHEVRKLKDALAEKASLHSYSTYVESMSESSVVLVLRFPKSCVGWIVAALTCKFLQEHLLSDVVVNGRKLTTLVAPQQELNDQLIAASRARDVVRVVSLLNSGADVNTVDRDSATALDKASYNGLLQVVRLLLGRGSEVECKDKSGWTPLITAAYCGKYDVVLDLLDSGAEVDAQSNDGFSALILAAKYGHTEVVVELVKAKANLDPQTEDGDSALITVADWGRTEVVVELVKAGALLDLQNTNGYSALMRAAYRGRTEVVVELVKAGALLDLQNTSGDSAVIMATVEHRSDVLRVLVDAGSDLNVQNEEGLTAVMISARSGRSEITDILVEGEHIDLDIQENSTGWSALHFAAENGDVITTQSLLKAGANALLKDKNGLTALDIAESRAEEKKRYYYSNFEGVIELLNKHIEEATDPPSHHVTSAPEQDSFISDQDDPLTQQDNTPTHQDSSTNDQRDSSKSTDDKESPSTQQDSSIADQDRPSGDQDTTTTEQIIPPSGQRRRRRGVSQTLRNLVNVSGQRIQQLFNDLDRRLKSADKKDQSGVRGQEGDGVEKKTQDKDNRTQDVHTSSQSTIT